MEEYGSANPRPPKAAAPGGADIGGADGCPGAVVNVGAVAHGGSGDGDGGNLTWVIGTPCCDVTAAGGGGGGGDAVLRVRSSWRMDLISVQQEGNYA